MLWCDAPMGPHWELPVVGPPGWCRALLGWSAFDSDDKPPRWVQEVLSAALVRHADVTFPFGLRAPFGHTWIRRKWRVGTHFVFRHATTADEARGLFDADLFDWCMGGQRAFLSKSGGSLPNLTEAHLEMVPDDLASFGKSDVIGLVQAGVDGDVAGLYLSTQALRDGILAFLQTGCEGAGADWQSVSESDFQLLLSQA
jgi:hypothetical protein